MADIVVVGGGIIGQCTGMLLAADGHAVTVLERDPDPPPDSADAAWDAWTRRGVNQFHMIHFFLPRFRAILEAELPSLVAMLDADGALRLNMIDVIPAEISGGRRDGDERYGTLTARRPVMEAAVARVAATTPGLTVVRGRAVRGLVLEDRGSAPHHVAGVVTDDGDEHRADLVVDAGGRRSAIPQWLHAGGTRSVVEQRDDCGFVYYARHFRSGDGSVPPLFGPPLQDHPTLSILTLPADNGTWGVGLIVSARDRALRGLRDPDRWASVLASYPLAAHWLDGEPISDLAVMAAIEDRHRSYVVDGVPVVTGLAPVGDAWACTNPSFGRGATIGLLHALALRDELRRSSPDDALGFAHAWNDTTGEAVEPFFRDVLDVDHHRLAEIDVQVAGGAYETDDHEWRLQHALTAGIAQDPDLLRALLDVMTLSETKDAVFARPGLAERAFELGGGGERFRFPGPSRDELLALAAT